MRATVVQKTKIGIFTIVGLLILLSGILVIGARKNMFTQTFLVYGDFKNVAGLQIGNIVRFSGIDAGTVSAITIRDDSTVRVTLKVKEKIHKFLKDDAVAAIGSDGLMGDKLINISPGVIGAKIIADGGQIRTANPQEFDKIINKISRVADNAEAITDALASIALQINSGKGTIGRLIYSDTLEKGLENTVRSVHETVKNANKGVEGFQQNMDAMKHNFLLKGFYKKKARKERKEERKEKREEKREEKKLENH